MDLGGAERLRGLCEAPKRGWELAEPRPIALLMIPSLHFVGRPFEKGSFKPEPLWIGTRFTVKSVVNKVVISLPAMKNTEILVALEELMDNAMGMVKHADIRKLAGRESLVAGFLLPVEALRPPAVGQSVQGLVR